MAPRISNAADIETRFGAKTDFENLQKIFELATPEASPDVRTECFKEAWAAYAQPDRKYHNTAHVGQLYRDLAPVVECSPPERDVQARAVWLSVLYHDVVHRASAKHVDEAASIDYFYNHSSKLKIAPSVVEATGQLIARTSDHFSRPKDLSRESHLFLDADLAGLSEDPKTFLRHEAMIRQEYRALPDAAWNAGRVMFCRRALGTERIYHSRYFGLGKEWIARTNLVETIARLSI